MTTHIRIPDVSPMIQAVADGSRTIFTFPFPVFEAADLEVHVGTGVMTSGYTVVGEGSSTGGAVAFATAPTAGSRVTLRRKQTYARTGDFLDERAPTPHELNDAVDEAVAAIQELAEQASRSVRRPLSADLSQPVDLSLPDPEAGKLLGWNGSANALVNVAQVDTSDVLRKSQNLADLPDKAQARINLGLGSAATKDSGDFATAAQGAKADSALQASDIGVSVQAHDADLDWLAANLSSAGRALIDDADAAAQRATLGLAAVAASGSYTDLSDKPSLGKNTGVTVIDPGTSCLEVAAPFVGGVNAITGDARTCVATDRGQVVRRSNGGAAMTDTLPGTSSGILAAGWFACISNSDALANLTIAAGAGATLDDGASLVIGPGQNVTVNCDGAAYWSERGIGRKQLHADLTLYVATTGSDTANTGLTSASPFATLQRAYNLLQSQYDLNGHAVTIQLADGTYTSGLYANGPIVGQAGATGVIIQGNASDMSSVAVNSGTLSAINLKAGAALSVRYIFAAASGTNTFQSADAGSILHYSHINFGATNSSHVAAAYGGAALWDGPSTISGGASYHWYALGNSAIMSNSNTTFTVTGTPTFLQSFAGVFNGSILAAQALTFSGSATGKRYVVNNNGVIDAGSGGADYFPGSSPGSTSFGGQYIG